MEEGHSGGETFDVFGGGEGRGGAVDEAVDYVDALGFGPFLGGDGGGEGEGVGGVSIDEHVVEV